jgi:Glycosyltransferase family 9 (heptosyltransferase)
LAPSSFDVSAGTGLSEFLTELASHKPNASEITRQVYQWAFELDPENHKALHGLGLTWLAAKQPEKAWHYLLAASSSVKGPGILIDAAIAAEQSGWMEDAERCVSEALLRDPGYVPAYVERACLALFRGEREAAERAVQLGLAIAPEDPALHFCLATILLERGDYEQGWRHYESRPSRLELASLMDEYPEWDGSSVEGKSVLVCREQGFGDEIMFARYLPMLHAMGAEVIYYCYPELARLFARNYPFLDIVTTDREMDSRDIDCWIGSGSLPRQLGAPIPWQAALLDVIPADVERFRGLIPDTGRLKAGLCWKGNPKHSRDEYRSIPFAELKPLLEVSGCDFYSLQRGDTESGLLCLADAGHDVADTAAAIANLDLVITCDSAVGHLAGAMGKKVWILLGQPSDWRWGRATSESPWYPSALLLRNEAPKQWGSAIGYAASMLTSVANWWTKARTSPALPLAERNAASPVMTGECRYGTMSWLRNDHYVGRSLDLYHEYSQSEADLLAKVIRPGDAVVEAGANAGGLTVALAAFVGHSGSVIAFEPQPEYFALLQSNTVDLPQVSARSEGLGAVQGEMQCDPIPLDKIHAPSWAR